MRTHALSSESKKIVLVGPLLSNSINDNDEKLSELHLLETPQIAVDGGIRFVKNPVLWVGDGDSSPPSQNIQLVKKESQNETDLRFCLSQIRNWQWTTIHLFGFLGGRKDHELANWGEIYREMKTRPSTGQAIFYDQSFCANAYLLNTSRGDGFHSLLIQGRFSVFSFESSIVSVSGECKFTVQNIQLECFSGRGLSNEVNGLIQIKNTAPILVITGE